MYTLFICVHSPQKKKNHLCSFSKLTSCLERFIKMDSDRIDQRVLKKMKRFAQLTGYFNIYYTKYNDYCQIRIRGAMVARLTPDQKVACSIHVGFNFLILFYIFSKICQQSTKVNLVQVQKFLNLVQKEVKI